MKEMSDEDRRAFLSYGTRTGKVATVRADGSPHVVPVWFVLDGDDIVFTTWHESVKAKSIQRDGRASLVVDEEVFPYSFVMVDGRATVSSGADVRRRWARSIAERYVPPELVESYVERNAVEGELVVRLKPRRILAQAELA